MCGFHGKQPAAPRIPPKVRSGKGQKSRSDNLRLAELVIGRRWLVHLAVACKLYICGYSHHTSARTREANCRTEEWCEAGRLRHSDNRTWRSAGSCKHANEPCLPRTSAHTVSSRCCKCLKGPARQDRQGMVSKKPITKKQEIPQSSSSCSLPCLATS